MFELRICCAKCQKKPKTHTGCPRNKYVYFNKNELRINCAKNWYKFTIFLMITQEKVFV